jgi:putative ABC transport system ATP-binding protein
MSADRTITLAEVAACDGISRRFDVPQRHGVSSTVLALDDVSLSIAAGRLVALNGPSGSGKSTLLAMLAALDHPTSGTVTVQGTDVGALGRAARRRLRRTTAIMVLPQPADNLLLARTGRRNLQTVAALRGVSAADTDHAIDELVARVGMRSFIDHPCGAMSGGEQQRLAVACALMGSPALVLADEPTGALDATSAATVVEALRAAVSGGATIVVATHDPHVVAAADDVIRLDHGRRVE